MASTFGDTITLNDSTQLSTFNSLGMRNRIINGAMVIDQRNAGASVTQTTSVSLFSVDRWQIYGTVTSKFTAQQNAGSVTPPVGFKNYLGITSSSAYSVLSNDQFVTIQVIEGFNVADFGWGTANAQAVSVSFWVRSSLTGAFGASVQNSGFNRSYPFSFTISAANAWEQKTVTIPGDTSGTWLTDNGAGIRLYFNLGTGASGLGPANAWASAQYIAPTGAVSVVGTSGATFYITGVQLEKGSTATPFEYRPYGTELGLCQRYYEKSFDQGVSPGNGPDATSFKSNVAMSVGISSNSTASFSEPFSVVKRVTPTLTLFGNSTGQLRGETVLRVVIWSINSVAVATSTNRIVASQQVLSDQYITIAFHWSASAEL